MRIANVVVLPADKQPTIRIIPMPADTNANGTIFGGWEPVFVGDLVSFYANVVKTGRTSITVDVEVYAQRHRFGSEVVKVTEAQLTYVAIDDNGNPRALAET